MQTIFGCSTTRKSFRVNLVQMHFWNAVKFQTSEDDSNFGNIAARNGTEDGDRNDHRMRISGTSLQPWITF